MQVLMYVLMCGYFKFQHCLYYLRVLLIMLFSSLLSVVNAILFIYQS